MGRAPGRAVRPRRGVGLPAEARGRPAGPGLAPRPPRHHGDRVGRGLTRRSPAPSSAVLPAPQAQRGAVRASNATLSPGRGQRALPASPLPALHDRGAGRVRTLKRPLRPVAALCGFLGRWWWHLAVAVPWALARKTELTGLASRLRPRATEPWPRAPCVARPPASPSSQAVSSPLPARKGRGTRPAPGAPPGSPATVPCSPWWPLV